VLLTLLHISFLLPTLLILSNGVGFGKSEVVIVLALLITYAFLLYMVFTTEYVIDNVKLRVRCGFFQYTPIDINSIYEIAETNTIISAPAASFDRIAIKYGKFDEIILSPKNKISFVSDLTLINPRIKNLLRSSQQ
jgi:hypothetical protein